MRPCYEVGKTNQKAMSNKTAGAGTRLKCEPQTQTGRDFDNNTI